jgi:hypothetical protein
MENEQLDDEIPKEVRSIINKITTACRKERLGDVIVALGLSLIGAIMAAEGCSISEAVEHARNDFNEVIAKHSPRH